MKKIISLSVIIGITSVVFLGCAQKSAHSVERCSDSHRAMNQNSQPKCTKNSLDESLSTAPVATESTQQYSAIPKDAPILEKNKTLRISVVGQGVAPINTSSPAQAYALAKRAAVADSYRLIAEKVKGVYVEGDDLIQNMMVKRSSIRTSVTAMVKNANVIETNFKEGLCEVEMEIVLSHAQFGH